MNITIDTSWAEWGNYTRLLEFSMEQFFTIFPRDIFMSILVSIIVLAVYLQGEDIKYALLVMFILDFFLAVVLHSIVIFAFCFISAVIGGYALYRTYFGERGE